MARFRQACGRPELASEEENHVKITWTNVRHAVEAVRRMAEQGLAGLLCPKCCERLELRGESFCPLGFSGGSITSFSIERVNLSVRAAFEVGNGRSKCRPRSRSSILGQLWPVNFLKNQAFQFIHTLIGELKLSFRCQKCQAQQPLPANVKKELARRLTVQAKNRKKDQNGEAEY